MTDRFDVAVIGGGLIGSAAARHVAESGTTVALVCPPEPETYAESGGPFSSHYDEGRITRISDFAPHWPVLAARSIERYGDIAIRSGIAFHEPCGLAIIAPDLTAVLSSGTDHGANVAPVDVETFSREAGIRVPRDRGHRVVVEGPPAGLINPRRLIAAQQRLALAAGGTCIPAPADWIRPADRGVRIGTRLGPIDADRVLLASGAYGAQIVGVDLAIERRLHTIVRADVGLAPLPSLIVVDPDHAALDDVYWVPPVGYPDGRTLLKIGGDSLPVEIADSSDDIDRWFGSGGSAREAADLREALHALLPDRPAQWSDHRPCVVTYTPSGLPYIGWIDAEIAVAIGGCGAAAKSSDELGRLAAALVKGDPWPNPSLPAELFAPRFA
jgi:sarcosine oxidase